MLEAQGGKEALDSGGGHASINGGIKHIGVSVSPCSGGLDGLRGRIKGWIKTLRRGPLGEGQRDWNFPKELGTNN